MGEHEGSIATVRGRLLGLLLAAAVICPAGAQAAPVLVMGSHGRVRRETDRFLAASTAEPAPARPQARPARARALSAAAPGALAPVAPGALAARAAARGRRLKPPSVPGVLAHLYRTGQLDRSDYDAYGASWNAAQRLVKHLSGIRRAELGAVIANLSEIAAAGELGPSRLPALFLTLARNRQWWSSGPLLAQWQRVEFSGSQLVWEYYPGQGIELQVLGSFGKADGLYSAGPSAYPQLRELLAELVPLAAQRGGGLAWEYYFHFDGGSPPWVSAMSQATALEALTRAAAAFGPDPYLQLAQRALGIFNLAPPVGVRVATPLGARYLQYSFAPHTDIINAFLQSLIGLYDYARATGSPEAEQLFAAGNAQAQAELPQFDTGAWSLYQPGAEDSLDYHVLVTGFLDELCTRTRATVYCTTAKHFHAYLKTPPVLRVLTTQAAARAPFALRFALSKYSRVGIVLARGTHPVFLTSADFGYGTDSVEVPGLPSGRYTVRLLATDLPGNAARVLGSLRVLPRKPSRHSRST